MLTRLHGLRRWAGVDKAVAFTLLNYGLSALSLPLSLFLVARFFSPTVQGFYFTFSSILALQVVFELGFSQCITQFASHEFAHLSFVSRNRLAGDAVSMGRLASLARLAFKWYFIVAIILFAGLGLVGYVEALILGTPKDQLTKSAAARKSRMVSPENVARMEQEMVILERDFKAVETGYGENVLNLTLASAYIRKLLNNVTVSHFLNASHAEIYAEFGKIAAAEAL
jgi:hypothetical protein